MVSRQLTPGQLRYQYFINTNLAGGHNSKTIGKFSKREQLLLSLKKNKKKLHLITTSP